MISAFCNGRILSDYGVVDDRAVLVEDGRIRAIVRREDVPADAARVELAQGLLLPGFVDVQVNGGGGVLFGDAPTRQSIETMARAHARFGTTAFLPTLISGDAANIAAAIAAVDDAIAAGVPGVAGLHIEGPYLSAARKGIHNAARFGPLDEDAIRLLTSLRRGKTLVTLAPEETTPDVIRRLVEAGVVVSAGHTNATYAQARAALAAGVTGFTHLFNAMSPLTSRAPGVVGAALDDCDAWCGIIVDGHHVDPVVLRIALRCRRADRFMLITDAMPTVGAATKTFLLDGRPIHAEGGACRAEDGTLAGTDLDMAAALRNAMTMLGVDLYGAVQMASRNPATFLALDGELGRIAPGHRANFVLATDELTVHKCWIGGQDMTRDGA